LDEPFSALDPLIRKEMQQELLKLQGDLRKTIVFITHDFDEALRLADRMAIMKDGEIIQVGTPEQIVLSPATGYVRAFTKDVPRAKVLKAETLMRPPRGDERLELRVKHDDTIESIAATLIDSQSDAAVVDPSGIVLGVLERGMVIDALLNRVRATRSEKAAPENVPPIMA
jgi:glycine betaine/proline transport system ATP-binding protein